MKSRSVFTSILSLTAAVLLLLPLRASAQFSFVQATNGGTGNGFYAYRTSFTMSWPSASTTGDCLFACISGLLLLARILRSHRLPVRVGH